MFRFRFIPEDHDEDHELGDGMATCGSAGVSERLTTLRPSVEVMTDCIDSNDTVCNLIRMH